MVTIRTALTTLALSLATAALSGCGLGGHSSGPLFADARSPITDVPVPVGFGMGDKSRAGTENNQRVVDHYYTGKDQILPVVAFYKEQMPKHGWKLDDGYPDQISGKEIVLRYSHEKPTTKPETCTITVTSRTFDTAIRIKLDPSTSK